MSKNDLVKAISKILDFDKLTDISTDFEDGDLHELDKKHSKLDQKLVVHHNPRSMEAEHFRFLKTKIEHYFGDDFTSPKIGRIILITGATLGAGKTTCALNLAMAFAKAYGSQILFLDADCRHLASQKNLGLGEEVLPGLTDVLIHQQRVGSLLINTGLSNLLYLPSGDFSEEFVDRLRSEELTILLDSLKNRFRYIIIDAPPVFPMPEPGILANHCDGVLIVLGAGVDGKDQLTQAIEALKGTNIMGVILNKVRKSSPLKRYGSYGYYNRTSTVE